MTRSADTRAETSPGPIRQGRSGRKARHPSSNRTTICGAHSAEILSGTSISLFVYGTLKRGYSNHDSYCRGVLAIEKALVRGHLNIRPDRIPFLEVPEQDILAEGTADPLADAAAQEHLTRYLEPLRLAVSPVSGRGVVHGELLLFDDPDSRLPAIDRLEGFRPGGRSLYRRVLVPVLANGTWRAAWVYVVDTTPLDWRRLASGCWTG